MGMVFGANSDTSCELGLLFQGESVIYLHLGAHKTATTYLQTRMAINQGRIYRAGRAYWPLEQLRPRIEHGLTVLRNRHTARLGIVRRLFARSDPFSELRRMCQLSQPVILSDENMLGHASSSLGGELYRDAEWRLGQIAVALGDQDFSVLLCIRAYPDFIASIYAEALRHGFHIPIDQLVRCNASLAGQWTKLADIVAAQFPGARITVWQFEDFRVLEPIILKKLTGLAEPQLLSLDAKLVRPSASARAVEEQAAKASAMSRHERVLSMAAIEDKYPLISKSDRFDPWTERQRASMTEAYQRDLEELASRPDVRLLSP